MEYRLANGSAITDEDIERECAEYESGSWEGNLVNLRADRSKLSEGGPTPTCTSSSRGRTPISSRRRPT